MSFNAMTPHDRYIAFMHGRLVDRPPLQEWGPWEVTVRRWMRESGRSREQVRSYLRDCDFCYYWDRKRTLLGLS